MKRIGPKKRVFRGYLAVIQDGCEPEIFGPDGSIYPFDEGVLAVRTTKRRRMKRLSRLPDARLFSVGEDEWTVLVPDLALDLAAKEIGAKKAKESS